MQTFKIFLEYEGTRYSGWQIQKNARTVQGEIHSALMSILNTQTFEFQGAGRTDAGVHALCQVAHLAVPTMLAPEILKLKLNDALPPDINILEIEKAPKGFHARHDAQSRSYLYQISRRRTAFGKRYVWWIKDRLDIAKMKEIAKVFEGMHDFRSFTADDPGEKSTKVLLERLTIAEEGALILIRVVGSHFLWKMVRQMVGVIAEVGRGSMTVGTAAALLDKETGIPAKLTAPPSGLFLEEVHYGGSASPRLLSAVLRM